jgi:hypothetical protein
VEGDKRIAGSIAWVALAAIHYQNKFKSKEFVPFNYKILSYLETQMHAIEVKGAKTLALKFAPSDVMNTKFYENDVTALEHNLDAYAAFKHFQRVNKVTKWTDTEKNLKNFILLMWDEKRKHFWSGANFSNNTIISDITLPELVNDLKILRVNSDWHIGLPKCISDITRIIFSEFSTNPYLLGIARTLLE